MASRLFISYRTEDSGVVVQRLREALTAVFVPEQVFVDRDSILAGERWRERLAAEIARSSVFFCVIGNRWLHARNEESGQRRLDESDDPVRVEIEAALER